MPISRFPAVMSQATSYAMRIKRYPKKKKKIPQPLLLLNLRDATPPPKRPKRGTAVFVRFWHIWPSRVRDLSSSAFCLAVFVRPARFTRHRFPVAYLSCAIGSPILHAPSNAASPSLLTIHSRPHARGPLMQVFPKVCDAHRKRAECQRQVPRRHRDARGVFGNATQPPKAHPPSGCRTVRLREE